MTKLFAVWRRKTRNKRAVNPFEYHRLGDHILGAIGLTEEKNLSRVLRAFGGVRCLLGLLLGSGKKFRSRLKPRWLENEGFVCHVSSLAGKAGGRVE